MKRAEALLFVSYFVDDTGNARKAYAGDLPPGCTLIGWQCGFEPLFVAVGSYLPNCYVGADEAEELAAGYLAERDWFGEGAPARDADYIFPSPLEC